MDFQNITTEYINQDHLIYEILFYFVTVGEGIVSFPGNVLTYFCFYFLGKGKKHTHIHLKTMQ